MSSDKQHLVPRFYLRHFSEGGRRLNVYNLKRTRAILGASLKGQCYGRRVYGEGPELEKALSNLERVLARVVAAIVGTRTIPKRTLPETLMDYFWLLYFISSQVVRPASAMDEVNAHFDLMVKHLVHKAKGISDRDLALVKASITNLGPVLLEKMHDGGKMMLDLKMLLLAAPASREFITSDNPLVRYNTYAEGLPEGQPSHGITAIGIQLFLPLSPQLLLVLFDGATYLATGQGELLTASEHDVDALNLLQVVFAGENLYFLTDGKTNLLDLSRRARVFRGQRRAYLKTFIQEGQREDKSHSEIMLWSSTTPNLHLKLDTLRVRKAAARRPLHERYGERPNLPNLNSEEAHRNADRLAGKRYIPTGGRSSPLVED